MKKHNRIKRSAAFGVVLLLLVPIFAVFFSPSKAYAADTASQTAEKEWRALAAFDAIRGCTRAGVDGSLSKDKYGTAEGYSQSVSLSNPTGEDPRFTVGRLFDGDDGRVDCGEQSDLESLASAVGYSVEQLNDVVWPRQGCNKDDCPLASDNTIEDNLIEHIKQSGLAGPDNDTLRLSDAGKYWYWYETYSRSKENNYCGGSFTNDPVEAGHHLNSQQSTGDYYKVEDNGTVTKYTYALYDVDNGDEILALSVNFDSGLQAHKEGSNYPDTSCKDIAGHLNEQIAKGYVALIGGAVDACKSAGGDAASCAPETVGGTGAGSAGSKIPANSCEDGSNSGVLATLGNIFTLKWLFCPLISGINSGLRTLDNAVQSLLSYDALSNASSDGYKSLYSSWNSFRQIANILFIIIFLLVIFSQALSIGIFDAYTVKKMLPKLVIGIIGVQISWYLCILAINAFNGFGAGIRYLIYYPFLHNHPDIFTKAAIDWSDSGSGTIGILAGIGLAGAGLGLIAVLPIILTGLFAVFGAFLVLVLRNMIITLLVLVSPVAFISGKKGLDLWWDSFSRLLFMYPLIVAFLAMGKVFAVAVAPQSNQSQFVTTFVKFVAWVAPYFLIPATFKFAGTAIASLGGFVNDRSKGIVDKRRQASYEKAAEKRARWADGRLLNAERKGPLGTFNRRVNAMGDALNNPRSWSQRKIGNAASRVGGPQFLQNVGAKQRSAFSNTRFQNTLELADEMKKMGISNDKALAALSGGYTDAKTGQFVKTDLSSAAGFQKTIETMMKSDDETVRVGASQLQSKQSMLDHYKGEHGWGNVQGAALMNWSEQGFAGGADLERVASHIASETGDVGLAASIGAEAAYRGYSRGGRTDLKPTYGWKVGKDGKFQNGTADRRRMGELVQTLKPQELLGSKTSAIKSMKGGIVDVMKTDADMTKRRALMETVLTGAAPGSYTDVGSKIEFKAMADEMTAADLGFADTAEASAEDQFAAWKRGITRDYGDKPGGGGPGDPMPPAPRP